MTHYSLIVVFIFVLCFNNRLETGPPTRTQPHSILNDNWRKTTLTTANGIAANDYGKDGPVAPPRRKRSSLAPQAACGFKELFGNNVSRRSSCDSVLNERNRLSEKEQELIQQKRKSRSLSNGDLARIDSEKKIVETPQPIASTATTTTPPSPPTASVPTKEGQPVLQRKISRVGNKKSDKFFGENLSDCLSDEPITSEPVVSASKEPSPKPKTDAPAAKPSVSAVDGKDELDRFIDQNIPKHSIEEIIHNQVILTGPVEIKEEVVTVVTRTENATQRNSDTEVKTPERKSSLDKKAEFLMAMLEDKNLYAPPVEPIVTPKRRHSRQNAEKDSNRSENVEEKKLQKHQAFASPINTADDAELYKGMTPVEEPIIVPRRRQSKHICDDDKHLHNHVHPKENHKPDATGTEVKAPTVSDIEEQIVTPKKPRRDIKTYEKAVSHQKQLVSMVGNAPNSDVTSMKPKPKIRHLSQENLFSAPSRQAELPEFHRLESTLFRPHESRETNAEKKLESILRKCSSQQSFLTHELLGQLADRVYGFQDPYDILENDTYDDGSSRVAPSSKMQTPRKISVVRKEAPIMTPSQEVAYTDQALLEKKSHHSENQTKASEETPIVMPSRDIACNAQAVLEKKAHHSENQTKAPEETPIVTPSQEIACNDQAVLETKAYHSENQTKVSVSAPQELPSRKTFEVSPVPASLEVSPEGGKQNTIDFLETERVHSQQTVLEKHEISADQMNIAVPAVILQPVETSHETVEPNVLDDIYKSNGSILHDFHKYLDNSISDELSSITEKLSDVTPTNSESNSSGDDTTDSDVTVKEVKIDKSIDETISEPKNRLIDQLTGGERRDSIVEVDQWFLKHNDFSGPRRGSETIISYDTRKVFPFGQSDAGAGSKFFDSKSSSRNGNKISIEIKPNAEPEIESNDHSTLLKYLK